MDERGEVGKVAMSDDWSKGKWKKVCVERES